MLPGGKWSRTRVLKNSWEFDNVFKQPEFRKKTGCFLLLARKNTLSASRLGMVIGKKNVRRSVDRNRLKRQIRESFRLSHLEGVDVVVLAQKGSGTIENRVACALLRSALTEIESSLTDHPTSPSGGARTF